MKATRRMIPFKLMQASWLLLLKRRKFSGIQNFLEKWILS